VCEEEPFCCCCFLSLFPLDFSLFVLFVFISTRQEREEEKNEEVRDYLISLTCANLVVVFLPKASELVNQKKKRMRKILDSGFSLVIVLLSSFLPYVVIDSLSLSVTSVLNS